MAKAKVMVALGDKPSVEGLIGLARQLANEMGAELIAFHVVQVPLATPIEARNEVIDQEGNEILREAARIAGDKIPGGFSTQLLRARNTAEAIIAEAKEQAVDLLVLGHRRKYELAEFLLGSTMRQVAHHAPCEVIVQIPAPSVPKIQTEPVKDSKMITQAFAECPGGITL